MIAGKAGQAGGREEWEGAPCALNRKHEALKKIIQFLSFSLSSLIPQSWAA